MQFVQPVVVSLWLSVLYLPFGGPVPAVIFFLIAAVSLSAWRLSSAHRSNAVSHIRGIARRMPRAHISSFTRSTASYGLLLFALLLLPLVIHDYLLDVVILVGIYVILALGLNIVVGFAGLLNLGFVAFYAVGAYSYALLNTRYGIGFWTALPFSVGISTFAGFLLAIPALRLRGDYLAIVTLGFGEITRLILNNWDSLTRGPNGIPGIAPPQIVSIPISSLPSYYYLVLCFVLLTTVVTMKVTSSRIGRAWVAIREDEIAASIVGINTTTYKLYAFAYGSFWAGLAGAVFAAKMRFVSPESFTFMESVFVLCMVILGGLGSIRGVILGALILVLLPEVLREIQIYRMIALGAGLVLLMVFRPQGLLGVRGASVRN